MEVNAWILKMALTFFLIALLVLLIMIGRGKKRTHKLLVLNMAGTVVLMCAAILSLLFQQESILDVAIIFALLNFLTVIVLSQKNVVK